MAAGDSQSRPYIKHFFATYKVSWTLTASRPYIYTPLRRQQNRPCISVIPPSRRCGRAQRDRLEVAAFAILADAVAGLDRVECGGGGLVARVDDGYSFREAAFQRSSVAALSNVGACVTRRNSGRRSRRCRGGGWPSSVPPSIHQLLIRSSKALVDYAAIRQQRGDCAGASASLKVCKASSETYVKRLHMVSSSIQD